MDKALVTHTLGSDVIEQSVAIHQQLVNYPQNHMC